MITNMFRLRATQFKITQFIVQTIAIYMMDFFFTIKKSTKVLFKYPSVLHNVSLLTSGRMKSFLDHFVPITQSPQRSFESRFTGNGSTFIAFAQNLSSSNPLGVSPHANNRAVYMFTSSSIRCFDGARPSVKTYRTNGANQCSHVNNDYITHYE